MPAAVVDPLELGQRLVAVLESGRRVATYKLASLIALLDYAVEHLPAEPDAALAVPVRDLAERVIEIYWLQVLPFDGAELKQSTGSTASILQQTFGSAPPQEPATVTPALRWPSWATTPHTSWQCRRSP